MLPTMKYFVNLKHPDKIRYAIKGPHGYFAKVGPINQGERSLKICGWKLRTLTPEQIQKLK